MKAVTELYPSGSLFVKEKNSFTVLVSLGSIDRKRVKCRFSCGLISVVSKCKCTICTYSQEI